MISAARTMSSDDWMQIPESTSASGILGVATAAIGRRSSFKAPTASSSRSLEPLVEIITGSTTMFSAL